VHQLEIKVLNNVTILSDNYAGSLHVGSLHFIKFNVQ